MLEFFLELIIKSAIVIYKIVISDSGSGIAESATVPSDITDSAGEPTTSESVNTDIKAVKPGELAQYTAKEWNDPNVVKSDYTVISASE